MPNITTNHAITNTNKTNIYWARCNNRNELWKILNSRFCHYVPKRGCFTALQFILFNFANYSPSIARELKVSKQITCKWQSQRFETKKYVSWALFLKLQTAEINFEKLLGWTVFKNPNFNPFQSSSVLPIRDICCICCVILTFLWSFKPLFLCFSWI